ncbi:MAG: cytochrome [Gemmatimonadetes bacterium]|nr:cytochrome [Gemmatimonadota bacterium]
MRTPFTPPYPEPLTTRVSLAGRFLRAWESWIHVLFDRVYTMKMGELKTPRLDIYIANERGVVARVMDDETVDFPKHDLQRTLLDPLIGDSVFSANGENWKNQREMINPSFAHTALGRAFPAMRDAVDDLIARLRKEKLSAPVHVDPHTTHVAADIIFRTLFSQELGAREADQIYRAFHEFQRHAQSSALLQIYGLPMFGYRKRAARAAAAIHATFAPIVRSRFDAFHQRGVAEHEDILQSLLAARHPTSNKPFTCDELIEQISLIFMAGHETAASVMSWALYLMSESPGLQDEMRAEIRAQCGDGPINAAALRQLELVRNVFRETLRLYPPISFLPRMVTKPTTILRKRLEAGAMLVISPWIIQRSSKVWRCPHQFDPDRFTRAEEQDACKHAYLPFGRGPRICVGAGFAQQEAMLVLATVVRNFSLRCPAGRAPEPISRLTLRAKNGVHLEFTPLSQ